MDALVREVHDAAAFAEHSNFDLRHFINNAFRRGVRDACWYVRDAAPAILSHQWDQLSSLAAGGGNQFIPALYALGLPTRGFKPHEFANVLKQQADGYRRAKGIESKKVEQAQPDTARQEQIEQQAQKDMMLEEEKKQAVTV